MRGASCADVSAHGSTMRTASRVPVRAIHPLLRRRRCYHSAANDAKTARRVVGNQHKLVSDPHGMEFGDAATGESLHAEAMVLLYLGVADFLPSFLPRRDDVDEFVAPPQKPACPSQGASITCSLLVTESTREIHSAPAS